MASSAHTRAACFIRGIWTGTLDGSRRWDHVFESGDSEKVVAVVEREILADPDLRSQCLQPAIRHHIPNRILAAIESTPITLRPPTINQPCLF